ncbi:MAG: TonB-dependent receptor [Chitinophagaceae bacterium]|jgi:outer membrane receptor protein involved in Fe transport|nr:TonB-dependent receptor [Chitinophagaceae bacterium]
MKNLLLLLGLNLMAATTFAQNIVKGKVTGNSGAGVAFAVVSVLKNDSAKQNAAQKITDSAGNYQLEIKSKGNYILQVSAVGFKDATKIISVTNDETRVNISLEKTDNQLSDVIVTTKKPLMEKKIDRLVMNVDNNPLTAGKSAMETLELAPGVVIYNGQMMLNGMPISRVMVNGKMLQLRGSDLTNYLSSLRSDDIKSIEIIAHPPAEYEAEGSGGLINIILKKNTQAGLNGSVYANYVQGKYAATNEGAQLNFKQGKIGLFANYSFYKGGDFQYLDQNRNIQTDGIYTAADSAKKHYEYNNIHTGITYDISDKQYLAVDYTGNFSLDKEDWYTINQIKYGQNPNNNTLSNGFFPNNGTGSYNNVGLNYHLQTDSLGSTFTFLSDYTNNYSSLANSVTSTFIAGGSSTDTAYRNNTPATSKIFTAEAKYLMKLKAASTLGFGGKFSATGINNQASFQYQSPYGSDWLNSENQNYIYDYNENIVAGYVNYQGKIFNTDVQFGLRGENTHYTGKLYDTSYSKNGKNYFGLFPTIFLKRNLDSAGNHSLSFNYSRRLSRPAFWQLSPHVVYVDNYTIGAGNPFLQPEYDNSYELSYTLKNKYIFTVNYTHAGDIITNGMHPSANNPEIIMQQPTNAGTMQKWMVTAYLPINIAKWWTTQEYIEYSNKHLNNPGAYDIQLNSILLNTNMQFSIAKDFAATLHSIWFNKYNFSNAIIGSTWRADMGLQKKFLKQRLTLKATVDDVFNTHTMKGTFYYNNFNLNFISKEQTQKFTLGATYNFNLGKIFQAHKIESSSEDEKSRLK